MAGELRAIVGKQILRCTALTDQAVQNLDDVLAPQTTAYLDGVEPIEPLLAVHDNALKARIESAMGELRAAIKGGAAVESVRAQVKVLDGLLGDAEAALDPHRATASASFFGAFTVRLREALEALLIVVVMLTILRKAERQDVEVYVHGGWISALVADALTWAAATYLISISGADREFTEGFGSLLAAVVLLWVGSRLGASCARSGVDEQSLGRLVGSNRLTSASQRRNPEEIGVQHVEAGQDQDHAARRFEYAPVRIEATQVLQPADADCADSHGKSPADGKSKQEQGADPWRAHAHGGAEEYDQCRRADRTYRD